MKRIWGSVLLLAVSLLSFVGCGGKTTERSLKEGTKNTEMTGVYQKITAEQAKKIMDEQTEYTIVDVRTKEEFAEGHIESALLIPDYEIENRADSTLTDKNKKLLVYCRSGRRSAAAAKELVSMGYTDVLDFGGIIDWPYETVK